MIDAIVASLDRSVRQVGPFDGVVRARFTKSTPALIAPIR
jgi:hypothetical protein